MWDWLWGVLQGAWKTLLGFVAAVTTWLTIYKWASWLWPPSKNRIVVFGIGGTGKTTLAQVLAESLGPTGVTGHYKQSFGIERQTYTDGKLYLLLVAPGQQSRRYTWDDVLATVQDGTALGVINVVCYGYQTFLDSYRKHKLYSYPTMGKKKFVEVYQTERLEEEIKALKSLHDGLKKARGPIWMVTLVTKEDLWYSDGTEVRTHYEEGEYGKEIAELRASIGKQFQHEYVYASLTIVNWKDINDETLMEHNNEYDQTRAHESVTHLVEVLAHFLRGGTIP